MKVWHFGFDFLLLAIFIGLFFISLPPLNIMQLITVIMAMVGAYYSTKTIRIKLEFRRRHGRNL